MEAIEIEKIHAEIGKLMAETQKLNKEIRWYEVVLIAGVAASITLAAVAVAKLFL